MRNRKKKFNIDPKFTRTSALPGIANELGGLKVNKINQPKVNNDSPAKYNAALVEGNQQTHNKFMNAAKAASLPLRWKAYYDPDPEDTSLEPGTGSGIAAGRQKVFDNNGGEENGEPTETYDFGEDYSIRKGMGEEEEKKLQQYLADSGYDLGKHGVDGKWGDDSEKAYQQYLKDKNK
jgi:hypothetical protein